MLLNLELLDDYAYLDELERPAWAWEILRRNDNYRTDFARLQALADPEHFKTEHAALAEAWHVRRLIDPDSPEVPEFYHERWQNIPDDLMWRRPAEWEAIMIEMEPPKFYREPWKHSIICKDLKDQGYSLNKSAKHLYPGHLGVPNDSRHHPARDQVRRDLKRFEKLLSEYLKIAYSNK